jgi:hypothetical protein
VATLVGTPSDQVPEILATGRSDVTTVFVSMSARHPKGLDAQYIEWHTLDHRPEQHRLGSLRASLRLVSTEACRGVRAMSSERYDAVDHVMSYFFAERGGLQGFVELSTALRNAGRTPELLPLVERGVYAPSGMAAAPRIKVGADVLPWWPARGVYLLIEEGTSSSPAALIDLPGVGGAWWVGGDPEGPPDTSIDTRGLQVTYLYLDEDPVETAERIRGELEKRWTDIAATPLLAAPFHTISPYNWARYVP